MTILALRTDSPEAEIRLYKGGRKLAGHEWQAHRQLAETLHRKIADLLQSKGLSLSDLDGIVAYKGPGSFTGLRIGLSVANALAYGLELPIVGSTGDDWAEKGLQKLSSGQNDDMVVPKYGAPVHTTKPKK